jgi:predicted flap endonuclease-1-like 5' DNA nuclease
MTTLIAQMLGCLLVAAGIGGVVGWLLRHHSALSNEQQLTERETELRIKGQALDTALYELKVKTSSLMVLESKISSLESLSRSTQQELSSRQERIDSLQKELADAKQRSIAVDAEHQAELQRLADQETALAAYAKEAQEARAARTATQQEQEILDCKLADIGDKLIELDRLRQLVAELEPVQGRVHWLEVQLSEKEAQQRRVVHDLEERLAARDRRLAELAQQDQLLQERDRRIAALERRIVELQALQSEIEGHAKMMGEQEEEISRLRKRLVEVRTALRVRDSGHVVTRPNGPANQLSLQINHSKNPNGLQKDDLKKIYGIGPVIERALNKMGTYTYIQIARWTPSDIAKVARKLETGPDRIKRDNWVANAKKQHREKYGEKI